MGNEKGPTEKDRAQSGEPIDETADGAGEGSKGDNGAPDPAAAPVAQPGARPRNGAGRSKGLGRKIKNYLN